MEIKVLECFDCEKVMSNRDMRLTLQIDEAEVSVIYCADRNSSNLDEIKIEGGVLNSKRLNSDAATKYVLTRMNLHSVYVAVKDHIENA